VDRRKIWSLLFLAPTALSAACSSSSGEGQSDAGPNATAVLDASLDGSSESVADGAVSAGDAASSDASVADAQPEGNADSGPSPSGTLNYGLVTVYSTAPGVGASDILADFNQGEVVVDAGLQTILTVDAGTSSCSVVEESTSSLVGGHANLVSAGTLSVSGAGPTISIPPTVATLADGGIVTEYNSLSAVLMGGGAVRVRDVFAGDAITIAASGAVVPAFSVDIALPNDVVLTQPNLLQNPIIVLSRESDFPLAWSGGPAGNLTFSIVQNLGGTATTVFCTFPESAGSGVIPAAVISYLAPTATLADSGPLGDALLIQTTASQTITTGGWTINVMASAQTAFGDSAAGAVIVQDGPIDAGTSQMDAGVTACAAPVGMTCSLLQAPTVAPGVSCEGNAAPAMTGGTIAAGTYSLVNEMIYNANVLDAGVCPSPQLEATLFFDESCYQAVQSDSIGDVESFSGTYSTNGNALTLSQTCPTTGTVSNTYTATPGALTLLHEESDGVQVLETYLMQ